MRRQPHEAGSVGPLRVQELHGEPGEVESGKIAGLITRPSQLEAGRRPDWVEQQPSGIVEHPLELTTYALRHAR